MLEYSNHTKPTRIGDQVDLDMLWCSNCTKPTLIGDQVDLEMLEYSNCTKPTRIGDQVDLEMLEYSNYTKPTRISHPMMSSVVFISFRRLLSCICVLSYPAMLHSFASTLHWPYFIIVFVIVLMWFRRPVQVPMSGFTVWTFTYTSSLSFFPFYCFWASNALAVVKCKLSLDVMPGLMILSHLHQTNVKRQPST